MENMHTDVRVIIKIQGKNLKKILRGQKVWKWRHEIFFPFVLVRVDCIMIFQELDLNLGHSDSSP